MQFPPPKSETEENTNNRMISIATTALGSRENALHWLRTPHPSLGYRAPVDVTKDLMGAKKVETLLRIK